MNFGVDEDVEVSDIEICRTVDDSLYLIAIKGAAVVPNRISFTCEQMESMFVQVGNPGETTMWSPSFGRGCAAASNYDYLIGYRSLEAQEAGFQKLLNGTIEEARAELERCVNEEFVIDHWTSRFTKGNSGGGAR